MPRERIRLVRQFNRWQSIVDASSPDIDYGDRVPFPVIWLDRLLGSDTLTAALFLLMLTGCCFVAPAAGVLSALGLLVCRLPEARDNAALLCIGASVHGVVFWWWFISAVMN
jgi:hypothetical protein